MSHLLDITKQVSFFQENRNSELRHAVASLAHQNIVHKEVCLEACIALQNLISGVDDIQNEELLKLKELIKTALNHYGPNHNLFGFLLSLNEYNPFAREIIQADAEIFVDCIRKSMLENSDIQFSARILALMARFSTYFDIKDSLPWIEKIVKKYPQNDVVCEQAYRAILALSSELDDEDLIKNVKLITKSRFSF